MLLSRRTALTGALFAVPAFARAQVPSNDANAALAELERTAGGRLGVSMLNLATGRSAGHRQDERFLLCSTFKALAAAFVLARVDRKEEKVDRRIVFSKKDLVSWSPGTEAYTGGRGMTVAALCEAAVTQSDNTAANLLLKSFGGPAGLTAFLRSIGDKATRLDRYEPALNEHDGPNDLRDTTSAAATLETLRTLLFGDVLSKPSRAQLAAWLNESDVQHVIYSSCNAKSLARDLERLDNYTPQLARVMDMFPQTSHYEVIVKLERKVA